MHFVRVCMRVCESEEIHACDRLYLDALSSKTHCRPF